SANPPATIAARGTEARDHTLGMAALILAGRNIALIVALVLTAILGTAAARAYPTTDVFCFVTAARLVAEGKDPYETMVWTAATAGEFADYRGSLRPSSCLDHFAYPLSTAIALIPLSWIDPGWVPFVWQIVLFAASAVGDARRAWSRDGGLVRGTAGLGGRVRDSARRGS